MLLLLLLSLPNLHWKGIPTIADVNVVYGNAVTISIISDHIRGILRYVGVDVSANALQSNQSLAMQILDTANIIASSYYYLNLMELALFFREIKSGKRGQVVWGSKLNTQELMVRLSEFVSDRSTAIEKNELEAKKERDKNNFPTLTQAGAAITEGINEWRRMLEDARNNFGLFSELFPLVPSADHRTWHCAWTGDTESLQQLGFNVETDNSNSIIKTLCDYNVNNK